MIKTFIKHWIYELCIQQLFNAFNRNFSTPSRLYNMKVGDTFYSITVSLCPEQTLIYYSPIVVSVNDDYFTIEGVMHTEINTYDGGLRNEFDGGRYRMNIEPADITSIGAKT
jgi:hypothetical protein